ncbi:hypothetical protein BMS3Abin03_00019 [bacterium BMS3Abin03]|nr:hypothetical protein BMS3Abin03_00019 [bacterium BMS3Abin03]
MVYRDTTSSVSDTLSTFIKNYYTSKRGIPEINTIGLYLPSPVMIDDHEIQLWFEGEIIKDFNWEYPNTNHAWQYFITYIMNPIQNYLDSTYVNGQPLKSKIKYIVLCKGIPLKINPYVEFAGVGHYYRTMVSLDGLICFLSQTNPDFSILDDVFDTYYDSITNPYFYVDKNFSGAYRFKSDYFGDSNYKINYLVSRLDGLTYNDVIELIDRSAQPDLSGDNLFLLDAHYSYAPGVYALRSDAIETRNNLSFIGYDNILDLTDYIYYSSSTPVIGYTSSGKHAGMPYNYNYLFTFEKPEGSIYNTYESFNGFYMDTLNLWNRQDNQGMITEWVRVGGSGGAAHTYEPTTATISKDSIFFPLYSIGYSMVDAAYQGIPYLAFRNVVVGDPLTTIAWGKQTLTQNVTWQNTNLVTDTITIPLGKTLTISANSVINLRHNGFITGMVTNFIVNDPVTFNITDWSRALFVANNNNNPKLEWGDHPSIPSTNGFRVYRKIDTGNWNLLATVYDNKYIDNTVEITPPIGGVAHNIFYRITAIIDLINESDYSNEVEINGNVKKGKISANKNTEQIFSYSLLQNYPNPFNPTTTISYSLEKNGLVILKVYDILGNEVATLVNENKTAGDYYVKFDASNLPSGIYFYRLISGSFLSTKKLLLLK